MSDFPKPLVGWSACLGRRACRYNGALKPNPLGPEFWEQAQILDFCPEEEAGLGTPRPPLDLYYHKSNGSTALLGQNPLQDRTAQVQAANDQILRRLHGAQGAVLKSRSPSCAPQDAARYDEEGRALEPGPGLLGRRLREREILAITEKELADPWRRFIWLTGLFQLARLDQAQDLSSFRAEQHLLLQGLGCTQGVRSPILDPAPYRSLWVASFKEPPRWAEFSERLGFSGSLEDIRQWAQTQGPGAASLACPFPETLT